ncbi:MAG: NAD(P)-dependent oxidoreductase [Rhodobacteraceae bacterium]|nr:NAD(P)-dependent oxidoreductase [Paracoccaceae bacterium]
MARVVVSGATGFLGGAVVRHLRQNGHGVVALGRDRGRCAVLARQGATACFDLSLPLPDRLAQKIGAADAFVHCAALSSPWGRLAAFEAANVTGTANALHLAKALGVRRFVNISSPTICFALRDQLNLAEDQPLPPPINAYAQTKAAAERLVLDQPDLGPVNLRPRGLYGPGETTLLPRLLAAAKHGRLPMIGQGGAIDLTYISDAVAAVEAALFAPVAAQGQTFHISGGEMASIRDIVEQTCAAFGQQVRWRPVPLAPAMMLARAAQAVSLILPGGREPRITPYALGLFAYRQSLDISKAANMLGWAPKVGFSAGLAMTVSL